jgi:hypothetical protein
MFYHKPFYEYKKSLLGISDDQDFDAIFEDAPEKDRIRNWQVAHLYISTTRKPRLDKTKRELIECN